MTGELLRAQAGTRTAAASPGGLRDGMPGTAAGPLRM